MTDASLLPAYNGRWRRHNAVPLSLIMDDEYRDGVGLSPKGRGGRSRLAPPSKSATGNKYAIDLRYQTPHPVQCCPIVGQFRYSSRR